MSGPGCREQVLEFSIDTAGAAESVSTVAGWAASGGSPRLFACANPHSLEVACGDPEFRRALEGMDLLVPDGAGILLASRLLGGRIRERVTGSDLFLGVNRALEAQGGRSVFFLGSTEETLSGIRARMARDFPRVAVAGTRSPPFRPSFDEAESQAMIRAVNQARPDVLWLGMTAPKQEKWAWANRRRLDVRVIGCVGAVFDFYSGRVRRPHPLLCRLGLEWLGRLVREPRRLWRRNFVSTPSFVIKVLAASLRGRRFGQGDRLGPFPEAGTGDDRSGHRSFNCP